jgi:hypothetical protein
MISLMNIQLVAENCMIKTLLSVIKSSQFYLIETEKWTLIKADYVSDASFN